MEQAFSRPRRKHGRVAVVSVAGLFALLVAILLIPVSLVGAGITAWIVFCFVLAGLWRVQFSGKKGIQNQIGIIGQVVELQYEKTDNKTGREIMREDTYTRIVDFIAYLYTKTNHNVAIMGMAGSGKTQLTYYIIDQMRAYKKIIFQYKAKDRFVEMGIPTLYLKKFAPNVFSNPDIFAHSWGVAFQGEATTYKTIPDIVKSLCEKSRNWNEFKKLVDEEINNAEKSDIITKGALNAIKRQTERLYMEHTADYDLPENIVIDFAGMDDRAFVFYAEFLLEMLYREIKSPKREGTMVFIDEASRFTGTTTIIPEMAEEIRATGALLVSTQRASRIAGDIKGNCALQVCFKQTEKEDLDEVKALSEPYHWCVQRLHPYEFVDLAQADSHKQIYIFSLLNPRPEWKPVVEWKPVNQDAEGEGSSGTAYKKDIDYQKAIFEFLSQAGNIQDLAKRFAQRYGGKGDDYRLKIKDMPKKMVKLNEINVETVDYVKFKDDKPIISDGTIVYFRKDENPSGLHTYLVNGTADIIYHKGITDFEIQPSGIGTADIETGKYVFEIETGLKNDINDLARRIAIYREQGKETIIIVPNQETKKKYLEKYPDVKIQTLPELWEAEL